MLSNDLLLLIANKYGLEEIHVLERVDKGYLSDNYILEAENNKYFLKKYRQFGEQRLAEVHAVKQFFASKEIPVILPFSKSNNESYFLFRNDFYALFPFVEGKQYYHTLLNDYALANSGRMLANIHLQTKGKCPQIIKERNFGWNKQEFLQKMLEIQEIINKKELKDKFDVKAEKFIKRKIILANNNNIEFKALGLKSDHIIHGDYHQENLFFDEDDKVKYVFDWEKTNKAPRMMELARALEFSCFYGNFNNENCKKAKIFLGAYDEVYPIHKEELRKGLVAWYLSQVHSTWVLEEHYLRNNSRIDSLLDNYIKYLNYHKLNFEKYCDAVLSFN